MLAGEAGNMRGFTNRCPHIECGAALPLEEPKTVQADASEEIAALESELALLEGDEQTDENLKAKSFIKARLHRLRNPRQAPAPKRASAPAPKTEPAVTFVPTLSSPVGGNIVNLLRSRLAEIDLEAKQIRAMLAAADAVS
jgi:hypothetical protein